MLVVFVGVLVGPLLFDGLTLGPTSSTVRKLAEATLALVLFSDASRINLGLAPRNRPPGATARPRSAADDWAGALIAFALFPAFSLSEALILGVILAPTDAGLGGAVVTDARLHKKCVKPSTSRAVSMMESASHCC